MFCSNCGREIPENGVCPYCTPVQETTVLNNNPNYPPVPETTVLNNTTNYPPVPETTVLNDDSNYTPAYEPVYETAAEVPVEDPGKQLATISMILGIVAISLGSICSCLLACLGGFIPLICAVVAIVLSINSANKSAAAGFPKHKHAQTGMILGIVAIAVIIVFIIINAIIGGVTAAYMYA